VLQLGLKDEFIEHGDPAKLLGLQGLDAAGIEAAVLARFSSFTRGAELARPSLKSVA
jgi:1-deoxy-D-xylulose-5-phosphate synthase